MRIAEQIHRALREGECPEKITVLGRLLLTELSHAAPDVRAAWHPLGFMHVSVMSSGPESLRVHVWPRHPPSMDVAASPIHNHVWELTSQILCGELTNHIVKLSPSVASEATDQQAIVLYDRTINIVEPTGELVTWKDDAVERLLVGQRYSIPPGVFHYTEVSNDRPVATLISANVLVDQPPRTLMRPTASTRMMHRVSCTAEEIQSVLNQVLQAIEAKT